MAKELAAIQMGDGLLVHVSRSTDDTLRFLRASVERLVRACAGCSAQELRGRGMLRTWSEFKTATSPPEAISSAFGRMLLNIHGLSAPMVASILERYPTPRELAEALDAHARASELRGLPAAHARWLLAEVLVPGKKRKRLSETVTDFFCLRDLPVAPVDLPPDSQL